MSTTLPYSGRWVPSMIPGNSRNWRRTSNTTAPAERDTALMARPENMNTTAAPMISPTRLLGLETLSELASWVSASFTPALPSAAPTVSVYDPKSAVAASTAVAIAMPVVIAWVVLPTASRSVSTRAPFSSMSPDISAMPCALSEIGPNVSIATITPTVVNSPVPASATANRDSTMLPPPRRKAPYTPAAMTSAEYTADSKPTEMPARMTVAGPVSEVLPMSWTGRLLGSVK